MTSKPITAKEELLDVHRDVVDGHLQLPDEGVATLFKEDGEKLLVEVIKEELEVRACVADISAPFQFCNICQFELKRSPRWSLQCQLKIPLSFRSIC